MGGGSNNCDQKGNQLQCSIYDDDAVVEYQGSWVYNKTQVIQNDKVVPHTSHSAAQNSSSIFVSFNGTQINVLGTIPLGEGLLAANYTIDGGPPVTKSMETLSQGSQGPQEYKTFFSSPVLPMDSHNISIDVIQTGQGRNYTFQVFSYWTDGKDVNNQSDGDSQSNQSGGSHKHDGHNDDPRPNVAAIVLSIVLGLLVVVLLVFYLWRRRRLAKIAKGGSQRLPPMMYYARPASREGTVYSLEPGSIIDTDSKFTFAVRRDMTSEPRRSWVSINTPPSVPESAVIGDRRFSDWSMYKGSSVIVQQSHGNDRSRFSPYTSRALSPMGFRDPTPLPRRGVSPLLTETLTETSTIRSSPGPQRGYMF